eukprot:10966986-Ditylum_brightwellii.AAC.1
MPDTKSSHSGSEKDKTLSEKGKKDAETPSKTILIQIRLSTRIIAQKGVNFSDESETLQVSGQNE